MKIIDCVQGSPEWHAARLGIPTASCFDRILTPTGKLSASAHGYMCALLAERFLGFPVNDEASGFMQRGTDLEAQAVAFYELQRDVETQKVGFCVSDDGRIGASPDRLVGNAGILEIKCPSAAVHVGYLLEVPLKFQPQAQGQLWVTGRLWVDLLSYHPEMPPALVRVHRDEDYIAALAAAMEEFLLRLSESQAKLGWVSGNGIPNGVLHGQAPKATAPVSVGGATPLLPPIGIDPITSQPHTVMGVSEWSGAEAAKERPAPAVAEAPVLFIADTGSDNVTKYVSAGDATTEGFEVGPPGEQSRPADYASVPDGTVTIPALDYIRLVRDRFKRLGWTTAEARLRAMNLIRQECGKVALSSREANRQSQDEARWLLDEIDKRYTADNKPREKVPPSAGPIGVAASIESGTSSAGATSPASDGAPSSVEHAAGGDSGREPRGLTGEPTAAALPADWQAALDGDTLALIRVCGQIKQQTGRAILDGPGKAPDTAIWLGDAHILNVLGLEQPIAIFGHPRSASKAIIEVIARKVLELKQQLEAHEALPF